MRTQNGFQATFALEEVKSARGSLVLVGKVQLVLPTPQQNNRLPQEVEQTVESAGQQFKRWAFRALMERLDAELVVATRSGKDGQGVVCRGHREMTFKTLFGTVQVSRHRLQHKADRSLEIPAARVWDTPQQVTITQGLQDAVCDAMLQESSRNSLRHIEQRAGEDGLLSRVSVLNLVHEEGMTLREAIRHRAEAVFASDPTASHLLPAVSNASPEEEPPWEESAEIEAIAEVLAGFPGALGNESVEAEQPRRVDPDTVMLQADEVVVHAQGTTGAKRINVYTTVVSTTEHTWYFAEENAQKLIYLVGALLAVLGVHRGRLRLLFVNDGASWIRDWFEKLPVKGKTMIACWYHLAHRCSDGLAMACTGKKHREEVTREVLGHLWEGRWEEALAVLRRRRLEMKCRVSLDRLVEYLEKRRDFLPDYSARQKAGLWIASNRVEKFNDWTVSQRCKGRGMAWTRQGVVALAILESARRNQELAAWRSLRSLPAWASDSAACQAA